MRTVSILGVGWLGLPLARKLIGRGYKVKGSVTSEAKMELLQQTAIWPFRVVASSVGLQVNDPKFFDTDVLIISIPPRRTVDVEDIFPAQIRHLIAYLEKTTIR